MPMISRDDLARHYSGELRKLANERFGYRHCLMLALEKLGYSDTYVLLEMAKRRDIEQFKATIDFVDDFKQSLVNKD